jgi:hypothetical protein
VGQALGFSAIFVVTGDEQVCPGPGLDVHIPRPTPNLPVPRAWMPDTPITTLSDNDTDVEADNFLRRRVTATSPSQWKTY